MCQMMRFGIFLSFLMLIFERQREKECGAETEKEGDRGSEVGSVVTAENLMCGSDSGNVRS